VQENELTATSGIQRFVAAPQTYLSAGHDLVERRLKNVEPEDAIRRWVKFP